MIMMTKICIIRLSLWMSWFPWQTRMWGSAWIRAKTRGSPDPDNRILHWNCNYNNKTGAFHCVATGVDAEDGADGGVHTDGQGGCVRGQPRIHRCVTPIQSSEWPPPPGDDCYFSEQLTGFWHKFPQRTAFTNTLTDCHEKIDTEVETLMWRFAQ